MSKRYAWPSCTVPECGHTATHKTEAAARKAAKGMQRRYTTPEGNAVCLCHDGGLPEWPSYMRDRFRCDQFAPGVPAVEPEPEPAEYDAAAARADIHEAISVGQPLDPRDVPPW